MRTTLLAILFCATTAQAQMSTTMTAALTSPALQVALDSADAEVEKMLDLLSVHPDHDKRLDAWLNNLSGDTYYEDSKELTRGVTTMRWWKHEYRPYRVMKSGAMAVQPTPKYRVTATAKTGKSETQFYHGEPGPW